MIFSFMVESTTLKSLSLCIDKKSLHQWQQNIQIMVKDAQVYLVATNGEIMSWSILNLPEIDDYKDLEIIDGISLDLSNWDKKNYVMNIVKIDTDAQTQNINGVTSNIKEPPHYNFFSTFNRVLGNAYMELAEDNIGVFTRLSPIYMTLVSKIAKLSGAELNVFMYPCKLPSSPVLVSYQSFHDPLFSIVMSFRPTSRCGDDIAPSLEKMLSSRKPSK